MKHIVTKKDGNKSPQALAEAEEHEEYESEIKDELNRNEASRLSRISTPERSNEK